VSCYEALAASYDGLTRDIPYEKYLRFFKTLLRRHGVTATTVLDLACGTGSLSVLLAKHGYRVLGVDRSEEMLTVAAEKAMELEENQPFFVAQPMQRLKIPEPVDACVCALDSINYVTKPQDVQKAFRRVYESLRPGGLFVFDINTPYKLEGLDGQVFLDETEDSYCVWRAVYDKRHSLCRYGMDLFQQANDGLWERSFEEHVERAYTPEELSQWLTDAGFAQVERFANLRPEAPEADELRIFFAAKKG
jgi:ubiquinone/menaquinone biosynthesis C-methylase UbiE